MTGGWRQVPGRSAPVGCAVRDAAGEAVFLVGPGRHEFSGPDIEATS
jgi:hypothetical protein